MPIQRTSSAQLFAALGDETRLGLIARLCAKGPLSITELTRIARDETGNHQAPVRDGTVRTRTLRAPGAAERLGGRSAPR